MNSTTWLYEEIEEMLGVVSRASNVNELRDVFEYILTPREINDMARRLAVMKMLSNGSSYCEIRQRLQVSSSLISRLSYHVGYGFRRDDTSDSLRTDIKSLPKLIENYIKAPKIKYKGIKTSFIRH